MKKIAIVVGMLLGAILMYLVGEQMYLYYKNDRHNVWFLFRNYSENESVNVEMIIDGEVVYNANMDNDHLPMAYLGRTKIPIGIHSLEIKFDGESLYKGTIKTLMNRYIIAEYYGENPNYSWNKPLEVVTSPRFIRDL